MDSHHTQGASLDLEEARPTEGVEVVRAASMSAIPWILHGFSTRRGGVSTAYSSGGARQELNLGFTEAEDAANVVANREQFLQAVTGDPDFPLATVRQVHSAIVRYLAVDESGSDFGLCQADGLMTAQPGILLGIQTADCIPVLVADRRRRAVAALHAGWRGTLKRIVENGVAQMRQKFGSAPEDLVAAIGPGIGQCCYRVGEELRNEFTSRFTYGAGLFAEKSLSPTSGRNPDPGPHLDLVEANRRQLLDAGMTASAITVVGECTSCLTDKYFSYRAERGRTGRMLSVIGISRA